MFTATHNLFIALATGVMFLTGGCTLSQQIRPDEHDDHDDHGVAADPFDAATAAVGLATATANLNALVASPSGVGRSLERSAPQGAGGPEHVSRVIARVSEPAPVARRTLVTVQATAGPPAEGSQTDRRRAAEQFAVPIESPRVTSRFGPRIDPITGARGRMHRGIDFGAPTGTPVLATASGRVLLGGYCDGGTGNCVVIEHEGGWRSQYFHLHRVNVRPGQTVRQGQVIGQVGSTGRSTGPHLHFQIGRGGDAMDPETLFGRRVQ